MYWMDKASKGSNETFLLIIIIIKTKEFQLKQNKTKQNKTKSITRRRRSRRTEKKLCQLQQHQYRSRWPHRI